MVYIIFDDTRYFATYSNSIFIVYCLASNCTSLTTAVMPLENPELWRLQGNPQVIADTVTTAYYIFTARRESSLNFNTYFGSFQVGVTPPPPTQLTDTPEIETDEHICLMWSFIPVAAWRTDLGGGYYGDMTEADYFNAIKTIRKTTKGLKEIDLACNADWGAGIWIEETSNGMQAFVSFNTYPAMMPIIIK
jgi:hypothetical protein